ncbi:MAG: glycosyltransferase [Deltaproteobacteria bacterium]|nr:glycosyltransferase [Deltaproteobacteria bacterium]
MTSTINTQIGSIELIPSKKGVPSCRIRNNEREWVALHSTYDPEEEAKKIVDAYTFDGRGVIVVLGLGLGYHIIELQERFPDTDIIVLEPLTQFYDLARERGMVDRFKETTHLIVGLSSDESMKAVTRFQFKAGMAPLSLFTLSSVVSALSDEYQPLLSSLKGTASLRLWERFRYQKFKNERNRVAIINFGYFLTRELEDAIRRLGHDVVLIPITKGEGGEAIVSRIVEEILSFKPDFFLTINHLGFDEEGVLTSFLESIKMPVASWYVDSPQLIIKSHGNNVSPYTTLFLWDRGYIGTVESLGFEEAVYLPLATDERVFLPLYGTRKKLKRKQYDIGFVGNSMVEPARERFGMIDERLHPFVEKCSDKMANIKSSFDELYGLASEEELNSIREERECDVEAAILWRATLTYRLLCIKELAKFDITIHGDDEWRSLLSGSCKILPPLNYYKELPRFYNACKINFNATNLQMGEAVNQRVFDVPACGGFLLTDHQHALEELFEVGSEVITYKERGEIHELADFYLKHPSARREVAKRGRERVLREHTYAVRLKTIIASMKGRYRQ